MIEYRGQHHGTNKTGKRESDPHDTVVDGIVFRSEAVSAEAGEYTHERTEADADEDQSNCTEPRGWISGGGAENTETDERNDQSIGEGADPSEFVAERSRDKSACGVEETEDGNKKRCGCRRYAAERERKPLCVRNNHKTEGAAAGEHEKHDVENGLFQHLRGRNVLDFNCLGLNGRNEAFGREADGTADGDERTDADHDEEDCTEDHEGCARRGKLADPVSQGRENNGADAVGGCRHTADHTSAVGEEFDRVADGASVYKAHAESETNAVAEDQVRDVLSKSARKHTCAKHNAARKHDPTGSVFIGKNTADDHGDKADCVCRREYGGKIFVQFCRHRSGKTAPRIHGTDAKIGDTADPKDKPSFFCQYFSLLFRYIHNKLRSADDRQKFYLETDSVSVAVDFDSSSESVPIPSSFSVFLHIIS